MNRNKTIAIAVVLIGAIAIGGGWYWYKSSKNQQPVLPVIDTTGMSKVDVITAPHADTSLIPILSKVLEEAFAYSQAKEYDKLAAMLVYRGADQQRYGYDVFNVRDKSEKETVRITAEVFAKWNTGLSSVEYPRVFDLDLPDGRKMTVLEVIFISEKNINRKFFAFVEIDGQYKIGDVTSYL